MPRRTHSTRHRILNFATHQPEGTVLRAKGLLAFGTRAAVDQALSRLASEGTLLRVTRGAYVRPVTGRFGQRAPDVDAVARSWATSRAEDLSPTPIAAANALGLTTQNPVRTVYLTSGPSRELTVGNAKVSLQHAPRWLVTAPDDRAGSLLRAGAWLGRKRARKELAPLVRALPAADREALRRAAARSPAWLAEAVLSTPSGRTAIRHGG